LGVAIIPATTSILIPSQTYTLPFEAQLLTILPGVIMIFTSQEIYNYIMLYLCLLREDMACNKIIDKEFLTARVRIQTKRVCEQFRENIFHSWATDLKNVDMAYSISHP
jgi:hypothetical protein